MNARQLIELIRNEPKAFKKSRYARYFGNFESGTGYDLPGKLRKNKKLYNKIARDAGVALQLKKEKETNT